MLLGTVHKIDVAFAAQTTMSGCSTLGSGLIAG